MILGGRISQPLIPFLTSADRSRFSVVPLRLLFTARMVLERVVVVSKNLPLGSNVRSFFSIKIMGGARSRCREAKNLSSQYNHKPNRRKRHRGR